MKIVHFVENLNRGGAERVVIDLALAQHERGHDCRVICLYEAGALAGELTGRGVPVEACSKGRGIDLRAIGLARRNLRSLGVDVLHSHNVVAHDYAYVAALGTAPSCIVNTRHGMGGTPPANVRHWLYRKSMRRTDYVAAVCEAARRNLVAQAHLPSHKVVVVPNGIHVERFEAANEDARRRVAQLLGVTQSTRVIGFVGRLNWAKDLATLIAAYAELRASRPDTVLALIGEGGLRAELTAFADAQGVGEHVRFLGDRSDVRDLLPGLDVFAMSSVSEGYSIALLEACAAALPIVATAVGGNAEIVRDGVNGRIVAARDAHALAGALADVIADGARASAMGRASRDWALQHATFEGMVGRYEALYSNTSNGRRG